MRTIKLCLAAVMLLLVTSCNKVESKMESMIPEDAAIVVKVDVPSLISNLKIEVKDGKMVLPEKFAKMLEAKGETLDKDAEKLVKSGIDFSGSVYLFVPDAKDGSMVVLAPVGDVDKLKQFLSEEEKATFESKDGLEVASKGATGYVIKDGILIVTNGFEGKDPATVASGFASLQKNMGDNASIVRALDAGDDINVYLNTQALKELAGGQMRQLGPNAGMAKSMLDLMDVKSSALHLSFADNAWNCRIDNEVDDNSDYAKLVKSVTTKPSADLLAFMPKATNMGVLNLNINGEGILNLDMVKAVLGEMASDPQMAQMIDIFKSVKGPVTVGFASASLNPEEVNAALAFKCGKTNELLDMLKQMFGGMYTQNGDEYVFNEKIQGFDAKLGVKGDVVYIKMIHQDFTENMASVGEAKDVLGSAMAGAFVNLAVDDMQMQFAINGKDVKQGNIAMSVMENGKKLSPLEALTFFDRLSRNVKGL